MNRRRFFGLTCAAVGAAVVAPWAAIKTWAKSGTGILVDSLPSLPFRNYGSYRYKPVAKSDIKGISFWMDSSTNRMFAGTTPPGSPDVSHLIEHEACGYWVAI